MSLCILFMLLTDHRSNICICSARIAAASLDIAKAYRNSLISPAHKCYLPVMWKDLIYVQHVAIEGLATAGGIQGMIADTCIALLKWKGIHPVVKWVDDFVFFQFPQSSSTLPNDCTAHSYSYDLNSILEFTAPLGIPWHPIANKGQDCLSTFSYIGFIWDISARTVSVSDEKHLRVLNKVNLFLSTLNSKVKRHKVASVH